MEVLIFLILFCLFYSPIATIARFSVHAANGFSDFSKSKSQFAKFASVVADVATVVIMPFSYVVFFIFDDSLHQGVAWFYDDQSYLFFAWILITSVSYFFAVNVKKTYSSVPEAGFYLMAGVAIVINLLIAFPLIFDGKAALALLGNLPLLLLHGLIFSRRHALLMAATPEVLDQRRYDQAEILDFLPTGEMPEHVHDYAGPAGDFLRQHIMVKVGSSIVAGGVLLSLSFLLLKSFGVIVDFPI